MMFSEQIERDNEDILTMLFHSPFVRGIKEGALPRETFDFYITQDLYLTYNFIRTAGICTSKAGDDDIPFFISMQERAYGALENTNSFYAHSDDFIFTSAVTPSCLGYSSYLLHLGYQAPIETAFAAMYPIPLIHMLIGERYPVSASHPYAFWLMGNRKPLYTEIVAEFRRFINSCASADPSTITAMGQAARTSFFFLHHFLQDVSRRRDFYQTGKENL